MINWPILGVSLVTVVLLASLAGRVREYRRAHRSWKQYEREMMEWWNDGVEKE